MSAVALLRQSACTVAMVVVAAPVVGFIGFSVFLWLASEQPLAFPLLELPGLYQELAPSLLACSLLLGKRPAIPP